MTAPAAPTAPPGRVTIADRVLERLATHALADIDEVGGVARRVLGVPVGGSGTDTAPRVDAHVDGHLATLAMTVSVVYPAPVRQVARRLRDVVSERIAEATGLEIRQVDIDIATLVPAAPSRRRVS
jgi:uncharacterized alkaline shock family protein YloU